MEPTDDPVLGKSKVIGSGFTANTAGALTIFGQAEIDVKLGHALEHASGDIFVVVGICFARPTGVNPKMTSVVLERISDKVRGHRPVEKLRQMIAEGSMTYKPSRNDVRPCRKAELTKDDLIFWIVETPDDIDTLRVPPESIETI